MSSPTVTAEPQAEPSLSHAQRVLNVFFAPSSTFADIRRSASWWVPYVIVCVASIAFLFSVKQQIGFEQVLSNEISRSGPFMQQQLEKMTPQQRTQVEQRQLTGLQRSIYLSPILTLVFWALFALVFWASFTFILGTQFRFKHSFAVVAYSSLPGIVKAILAIIAIYAGVDPASFMIKNPAATNIGYFLDFAETPRFLYSLATNLDVITIWTLILTSIGYYCVSGAKKGSSYAIVFGWFGVYLIVFAALATLF